MNFTMLRTVACGALLAGGLVFAPLAQAQTTGATGTTTGPAAANTGNSGSAGSGNAAAGNGSGTTIGGAPGQPAKSGSESGPAPHKNTLKGSTNKQ